MLVALGGWIVTGIGWAISQNAQRRLFLHQVTNDARKEIVAAIRRRQDYVSSIYGSLMVIIASRQSGHLANWPESNWTRWLDEFQEKWRGALNSLWIDCLEQYEVIFPGTADCRKDLLAVSVKLADDLAAFLLLAMQPTRRLDASAMAENLADRHLDEQSLLGDFLVYLQNSSLGSIVNRTAPFRQPLDRTAPRLVVEGNCLVLIDGNGRRFSAARDYEQRATEQYRASLKPTL
jgi:hypothetical protein